MSKYPPSDERRNDRFLAGLEPFRLRAPGERGPNTKRLFGEAVRQSVLDNFDRSVIQPGYFLVRPGSKARPVPARIWWRDHEPGNEENKLDRWPLPVLAAELFGEYCDPVEVWNGGFRRPLEVGKGLYMPHTDEEWEQIKRMTVPQWYRYACANRGWARTEAPSAIAAQPLHHKIDLTKISAIVPGGIR